jgi:hypothetical protein
MLLGVMARLFAVLLLAPAVAGGVAHAQALDAASEEALGAVLRMLQDPALRAGAVAGSPAAAAAERRVPGLAAADPAVVQEFYDLAADVFEDLARGVSGDADAMGRALARGEGDPAGFAAMLSPRTLERLRALAITLSDQPRR